MPGLFLEWSQFQSIRLSPVGKVFVVGELRDTATSAEFPAVMEWPAGGPRIPGTLTVGTDQIPVNQIREVGISLDGQSFAGEAWYPRWWHRDTVAAMVASNFRGAISVTLD